MTEKPILFSAPMIRAILNGRKTQTRRVLKPSRGTTIADLVPTGKRIGIGELMEIPVDKLKVPVAVGDMLWVRERLDEGEAGSVVYHADGDVHPDAEWVWQRKSLPSIHCPRGLSRITLKVTAAKVERLQDISEDDAIAEGVERLRSGRGYYSIKHGHAAVHFGVYHDYAKEAFEELWASINGAESWAANPWIVAYTFDRIQPQPHRAKEDV